MFTENMLWPTMCFPAILSFESDDRGSLRIELRLVPLAFAFYLSTPYPEAQSLPPAQLSGTTSTVMNDVRV
jgi:hypothetical protein